MKKFAMSSTINIKVNNYLFFLDIDTDGGQNVIINIRSLGTPSIKISIPSDEYLLLKDNLDSYVLGICHTIQCFEPQFTKG